MFKVGDEVKIKSDDSIGIIKSVNAFDDFCAYEILVNSETRTFFESQIELANKIKDEQLDAINLKALLTSVLLSKFDDSSLYSMNSAKIDYIPYQFRPVLKIIKSDEPRILIADGVGVGKTIEAGLILKELQARFDIKSILIICPKPLIVENKWAEEMKRFDFKFTNLDGNLLKHCIKECYKDGNWPEQYNKCIIPYSLLDEDLVYGTQSKNKRHLGLFDLNPFAKFDVVIVDEAHHIRNQKTKRYQGVELFLDNCDSAILLSATPLQMEDKDLYVLLNLLRPDLVFDYETFKNMAEPNRYISKASTLIRKNISDWQTLACKELENAKNTNFGKAVYSINPNYNESIKLLNKKDISTNERVSLIEKVESLHTFSTIINRTRRRDIGNFTIRKVDSIITEFTEEESVLYEKFLSLVKKLLSDMHGDRCIEFMMSTLLRQASSSLHALAPFMRDILNRKLIQLYYNNEEDIDDEEINKKIENILEEASQDESFKEIIYLSENLSHIDYKIDSLTKIIKQKSLMNNNKVMVFSSFRYTLDYIKESLKQHNFRVGIIHGDIIEIDRIELRNRFKLDKKDELAIDVLLFSDVGCEGLDYQFCDCLVNYDIPWNPQKIEQRIGRIDRKGQLSESVLIFNLVVKNTVDEKIYSRCLNRIGVFNSQIGDSEEIIGAISKQIGDVAIKYILNPMEQKQKLDQLSENAIRLIEEQRKLEDSQYDFFGLDIATKKMDEDVENAKNIFLSKNAILNLISNYFTKLEIKNTIKDDGKLILKLSKDDKAKLYEDYIHISKVKEKSYYLWENFLKSNEQNLSIIFDGEEAKNSNGIFVSLSHPLVKQALVKFNTTSSCCLKVKNTNLQSGEYPFEIYLWSYNGLKNTYKIKVITKLDIDESLFLNLLYNSEDCEKDLWINKDLEVIHYKKWKTEKERFFSEVSANIEYKKQTLRDSFDYRIKNIKDTISKVTDEKIIRMKNVELTNCETNKVNKLKQLDEKLNKIDIITSKLITGVLFVEK